ncbi:MAG: hypothetical protein QM635_07660 [Microbacteriaceae bacterium]
MQQLTEASAFAEGAKILHIGPPKTGTSAVQSGLHNSRPALERHSVLYPSDSRHPRSAFAAVAFDPMPEICTTADLAVWQQMAERFRASTHRHTILSSESLANASDVTARRIVDELGGELQVVITLRPLATLLASRWQQLVQDYFLESYDEWLHELFDEPEQRGSQRFWNAFRIDGLVRRWGAIVGERNVTLLVPDPDDRGMLLRSFERFLDLPAGALVPDPADLNGSLPYPEVELLRAFNRRFARERRGRTYYVRSMRSHGLPLVRASKAITGHPGPIPTPGWAVERSNALQRQIAEGIRATDARVVGDLDSLVTGPGAADATPPGSVAIDAAADLAYAAFVAAEEYAPRAGDLAAGLPAGRARSARALQDYSGRELLRALGARLLHRWRL